MKDNLDLLLNKWTPEEKEYAIKNRFPYLHSKAQLFLKIGPEKYRKLDAFQEPPFLMSDYELSILKLGCEQVLEGRGIFENYPFVNLHISGFYNLMRLFHFEKVDRNSFMTTLENFGKGFLDEIIFKHYIDSSEIKAYNFVKINS